MNALRFILCLGLLFAGSSVSHAGFTIVGPTPYRSAADSPFNLSGLGTTFFLEDFEDGELNVPGVVAYSGIAIGNSVDADDGIIDGIDNLGFSGTTLPFVSSGSTRTDTAGFIFNQSDLGLFPNAVGLVITSQQNTDLISASLSIVDASGMLLASFDTSQISSEMYNASDDLFIGIVSSDGIPGLLYSVSYVDFGDSAGPVSIDHFQYGLLVPELSTFLLALLGVSCYFGRGYVRPSFL